MVTKGLWFDKLHGNLLKVDAYGNILVCANGFNFLKPHEITQLYPNKFVQLDDSRLFVLNTLFNLPETYMLACIIDYFNSSKLYTREKQGIRSGNLYFSFKSIFQDVRGAVDHIHYNGALKNETIKHLDKYVQRDERLPLLLERIRHHGAKTLLITNSDYDYTNHIMGYLMDFPCSNGNVREWTTYFDYIVVDAKKPLFFADGTILRQVDRATNSLRIGHHCGPLEPGQIYSGGSCDVLSEVIGAKGKDVLYVGDHIFGDILKSKKMRGWRTFLVIPELSRELHVWTDKHKLYNCLDTEETKLSNVYKDLDSSATQRPDISKMKQRLRDVTHKLDMSYGLLGSLFRSGSRQTFFAAQVVRYADIYAATFLNLLHYPFCYLFRAPPMLMPHESTVAHDNIYDDDIGPFSRTHSDDEEYESSNKRIRRESSSEVNHVPHLRANTPKKVTHVHDEDGDSDDSEQSSTPSDKSV